MVSNSIHVFMDSFQCIRYVFIHRKQVNILHQLVDVGPDLAKLIDNLYIRF